MILALAAALTLAGWSSAPEQSWSAHVNAAHTSVAFRTVYRAKTERGNWDDERGESIALDAVAAKLPGLTADQLLSGGVRVHFAQVHDAGTIDYTGVAGGGDASGGFTVAPNPQFGATLQRRGIGTPTTAQQLALTLMGADYSYLDVLAKQGFERPDVGQFVRLLEHGVSVDYLRGMAALRLTPHSIDTIVRARDHGVTPEYARAVIDAGYRSLWIDDLIRARDHGVSPDFIRAFRTLGYTTIGTEELIRLRDHGVSAQYVADLRRRGYMARLSVEDLIKLRDHGI